MLIDKHLLTILVCPVTKTPLQIDNEKEELVSTAAKLAYPVRDGIPVMLEDEARALSQDEFEFWHSKKA
ncbi:Trm112 family protein [Reinekea marina]|uniref:Trm112 family protein n=1 Tax=Reinekea marina TaxID=1310421 RepID=UPI003F495B72